MEQMREGRNGGKLKSGGVHQNAGRPKNLPALDVLMAEILADEKDGVTAAEAILKKLRQMAAAGNLKAAEMLLDRAYGKPKQTADITSGGESLAGNPYANLPIEKKAEILRILNEANDAK